jgi:TonB family protein
MKRGLAVAICLLAATVAASAVRQERQEQKDEKATPQSTQAEGSTQPATQKPAETSTKIVRTCGTVTPAKLIHMEKPDYPAIAKQNHICGQIVLHGTVEKDGSVQNLQYMSGPTVLTDSAMKAVKGWKYSPTLCGRDPVKVDTTFRVNFTLPQCDSLTSSPHR